MDQLQDRLAGGNVLRRQAFGRIVATMCLMATYLIGVATGLTVAVILGLVALVRRAHHEVDRHIRLVADGNKDFRRWVRDRDRLLRHELLGITNRTASGPTLGDVVDAEERGAALAEAVEEATQLYSGAHVRALAEAKGRALHESRDEATRKLRTFEALLESEGRLHVLVRRRRAAGEPRLTLPQDCRNKLADWRAPARNPADSTAPPVGVDDASRADDEPELARLEEGPPPTD
jgi:hypothetical protein